MVSYRFFSPWDSSQTNEPATCLPIRTKRGSSLSSDWTTITASSDVELHASATSQGLLVKIQPPKELSNPTLKHAPCDIVLVIDVSGSMATEAPAPGIPGQKKESFGLSVLDLVKHAARTILETLDEHDRLGIVTFASEARVLQKLLPMNTRNKRISQKNIEDIKVRDATNLWHGLREGLKLFPDDQDRGATKGSVAAMMVLTDGLPNHMCPERGYVPKLQSMGTLPATIHTFGFGYSLRSGLLKSIAEVGGGNYSFIPDSGMLGTAFVHAVANLQSTVATHAVLKLTYPNSITLHETTGESVDKQEPVRNADSTDLTISLGNIQCGQSRDIYLRYNDLHEMDEGVQSPSSLVHATLEYQTVCQSQTQSTSSAFSLTNTPTADTTELAYHESRSAIISFLSTLHPIHKREILNPRKTGEHVPFIWLPSDINQQLDTVIADLPASKPEHKHDPRCRSLLLDLCGEGDHPGQVRQALLGEYWTRWGQHYLPSLAGAHARQMCNSFKDPGPLMYGADSPLFVRCRDELDAAFDNLPAPKPSCWRAPGAYSGHISMSSYNRVGNACFAGSATVRLAATHNPSSDGKTGGGSASGSSSSSQEGRVVRIGRLRAGMHVQTPKGPRRVVAVLKTPVRRERMCLVGDQGLIVTPWHPISLDGKTWTFPAHIARRAVRYTGSIYSVLLERDSDADAHVLDVCGVWGVTMGHGLTGRGLGVGERRGERKGAREHAFFGDWEAVVRSLGKLQRTRGGIFLGGGVSRNRETGLVDGFRRPSMANGVLALGAGRVVLA